MGYARAATEGGPYEAGSPRGVWHWAERSPRPLVLFLDEIDSMMGK
ncbi:MAG: AAA family ATPase [bacterium]|nr:AAA family ATPase [bacterium]